MSKKRKSPVLKPIKRNSTPQFIKRETIRKMMNLGTYKEEYDDLITVYADTVRAYNQAMTQFIKDGEKYEVETEAGGTKKSGTASALEVLRRDIGTLSDRLLLNPKSQNEDSVAQKPTQNMDTENILELLDENFSS